MVLSSMIYREKCNQIVEFIDNLTEHKNVLIVDGVRQVGKTTAIKLALKKQGAKCLEINLEKQKVFRSALDKTQDFDEFEKLLKVEFNFSPGPNQILFIDEANESNQLGHYVRQMKEDWSHQTVILTGSMMQRLFRNPEIRIPVGRFDNLTITPFSFSEFLLANESIKSPLQKYHLHESIQNFSNIKKITRHEHVSLLELLDHYMVGGGVPELSLRYLESGGDIEMAKWMDQYLENLRDDFLKIFSQEYSNLFDRTVQSVANLLGQPYKKTALIKNRAQLAENILSVFENWKFIYKLEQKTFSPTKSNSLFPKRYLFDVGIAKHKRELGIPRISLLETLHFAEREPLGGLMEQLACMELNHQFSSVCGYKTSSYEVDFVLKQKDQMIPVECKAALTPNKNQYRSLDLYHQEMKNKKAILLSLAPYSEVKREGYTLYHLPLYGVNVIKEIIS